MPYTVQAIADAISATALGETDLRIDEAPADAGPHDLAIAMLPKYAERLAEGSAQTAILWAGADWQSYGLRAAILVSRPRMAMSGITTMLDTGQGLVQPGIHPTAIIDDRAVLANDVAVGAFAVIASNAQIGAGSVIGPHVTIGPDARIGPGTNIRDHVSIGARVVIGRNFRAQPGARIGGDGFSYVTPEMSAVEMARATMKDQGTAKSQAYCRIHSLGAVTIGDDVEMGANSTIDNGTIRDTVIGDGTKIDNLVHVGHNTRVGQNCLLCGQTGISGSVEIGNFVVLGGQTGVADNLFIGDRVISGGGTKILSNAPAGRVLLGYPAIKMDLHTEIYKAQRRLPRLFKDVAALKRAVFKPDPGD
ncbi:MAG: UDP-3-O-(3-hydroxymyristoyl)glucosamine N-acyltransferase [Rhodobacteraceae bacterium]|nr:UDP-3-O-(3-hydroxymyristoyl)glucosamine N-acyltransferase [Paracoccaceae bacterium]